MTHPAPKLEDPDYAAFVWGRYRRMLGWMALAATIAVVAALAALAWWGVDLTLHTVIATALGVGLSVLCAGALMGLVFLSSGAGHDEVVDRQKPPAGAGIDRTN